MTSMRGLPYYLLLPFEKYETARTLVLAFIVHFHNYEHMITGVEWTTFSVFSMFDFLHIGYLYMYAHDW